MGNYVSLLIFAFANRKNIATFATSKFSKWEISASQTLIQSIYPLRMGALFFWPTGWLLVQSRSNASTLNQFNYENYTLYWRLWAPFWWACQGAAPGSIHHRLRNFPAEGRTQDPSTQSAFAEEAIASEHLPAWWPLLSHPDSQGEVFSQESASLRCKSVRLRW